MTDSPTIYEESPSGKACLKNLTISLSLACNQGCSHCWVDAGAAHTAEMSNDDICDILRQAREIGAEHVKLTGGEPLLRRGFSGILSYAAELGFRISVETNGTLIRPAFISEVQSFMNQLHFYVSLDGASAHTHDSFRGQKGAFHRTISNLQEVRRAEGYFSIHTVVRRDNLDEIPDVFELARQLGASQHKLILSIHDLGRGSSIQGSSITPQELFALLQTLPEQKFWDYNWSPLRTRETSLMTTLPPAFQPGGRSVTCGWSQTFLAVLANGEAALCQGLYEVDEAKAGNVLATSVAEVWHNSPLFTETRRWSGADLDGICSNCAVADSCRGLCRASAIAAYGDLRAPYPLCQTLYEMGQFPESMLLDGARDCSYSPRSNGSLGRNNSIEIGQRRRLPLTVLSKVDGLPE